MTSSRASSVFSHTIFPSSEARTTPPELSLHQSKANTDSDWAGSIDDMKSTSGYAFLFGSSICSWLSKKQSVVAQSTAEAEYVSASKATSQAI
uniref:Uncharacterized protein n=1 Tax=Solanum lycopersicum TaxID=4081 RepID=A0A3Q7I1D4_SOLLC